MILKAFSVYDSAAKAYMTPWFLHQEAQARRVFGNAINQEDHQFYANPEDYTLFYIGQFDDETGMVESVTPESCGNGLEYQDIQ